MGEGGDGEGSDIRSDYAVGGPKPKSSELGCVLGLFLGRGLKIIC